MPRFRLRTLMIGVAVVAVACGARSMWCRSCERWEKFRWHAAQEDRFSPNHDFAFECGFSLSGFRPLSRERQSHLRRLHEKMKAKYRRAAYRPWASVEPDPPLSEFFEWDP